MTKLLREVDICVMMEWEGHAAIASKIRYERFPKPCRHFRGMGPRWDEQEVLNWLKGRPAEGKTSEQRLTEIFAR